MRSWDFKNIHKTLKQEKATEKYFEMLLSGELATHSYPIEKNNYKTLLTIMTYYSTYCRRVAPYEIAQAISDLILKGKLQDLLNDFKDYKTDTLENYLCSNY